MSMLLIVQLISNGLFIPMTASATDNVPVEQTELTDEEQAQISADEADKFDNTQQFIADLFTDETKSDIKSTVGQPQVTTAEAYVETVAEKDQQLLTDTIVLVKAFIAVNALLNDDKTAIVKDFDEQQLATAKNAVALVDDSFTEGKQVLTERLALVEKSLVKTEVKEQAVAKKQQITKNETTSVEKVAVKAKAVNEKAISGTVELAPYITEIKLTKGYLSKDPLDLTAGLKIDQEFGVQAVLKFTDAIEAGTKFTYQVPAGTYIKEKGEVPLDSPVKGSLSWTTDGTITLTVSEAIPKDTTGGFVFRSWLASTVTETPWELKYETVNKDGGKIPLNVQEADKPKSVFTKTGSNGGISYDTKTITYTVKFSGVEGAKAVADTLPEGVTFKELTSVKRAAYNKFTGKYSEQNEDKTSWKQDTTNTGFNLTRTGDIGFDQYEIVYTVDVKNPQALATVGANKVALTGNTSNVNEISSNTIEIKHADAYQKSSIGYDSSTQKIKWQIVYNLNGKKLDTQVVKDYFSNDFTFADLKVYNAKLEENTDGSPKAVKTTELTSGFSEKAQTKVDTDTNKICPNNAATCQNVNITMPAAPNGETYIIEYTTQANGLVTGGTAYNKAVIGDKTVEANKGLTNTVGTKLGTGIDYAAKKASWKLVLNTSTKGTITAGAVITDTFATKGMSLDKDSFKVKEGNVERSLNELDITLQEITTGNGGFTLTFKNEVPKNLTIEYKTNYEIIGNKEREVRNIASITDQGTLKEFELGNVKQDLKEEARVDGNKSGKYDPATKTITWTVNVNYYSKEIAKPVLTDTLIGNQTYVKDSLKVYNSKIEQNGNITQGTEATNWTPSAYAGDTKLTLTGPDSINSPYQVVYKTKIDATTDVHKAETYKNKAVLTSGDKTLADFEKNPSNLNNGDEFINKGYNKVGNKQYNWTININRSQSELKNVVVEDAQKGTLILDSRSFKLERYDYNESGNVETVNVPVTISDKVPTTVPEDTAVAVVTGDRYFKLYLGDVARAYKLTYTSYYEGEPKGEALSNEAKFFTSGTAKESGGKQGVTLTANQVAYVTGIAWLDYKPTVTIHKIAAQTSAGVDVKVEDLANIPFKLYDETGTVLLDEGTTDDTGNLAFTKQFAPGYYYLVEDQPTMAGYQEFGKNYNGSGYGKDYISNKDNGGVTPLTKWIGNKTAIRVEVSANTVNDKKQVALTVKNYLTKATGCIVTFINKEGDKTLKDSEYKVTDAKGTVIFENIKADNNGNIVTPQLPKGEYVLVQTKSPEGSTTIAPPQEFKVVDECTKETIVVEQPPKVCDETEITVTTAKKEEAKISVTRANGTVVDVSSEPGEQKTTTTTNHKVTIPTALNVGDKVKITIGKITKVIEVTKDSVKDCKVTVDYDKTPGTCENIPIVSITPETSIKPEKGTTVTVTPEDGEPKTGKIVEKDGKTVVEFEPGKEPELEPGKKVTITVEGYDPVETTVPENCEDEITITPITSKLACEKFDVTVTDNNGKVVKNATVTVDGTAVKGTTDANGQVTFKEADKDVIKVGTNLTVSKNGYETATTIVGKTAAKDCSTIITMQKTACTDFTFTVTDKDGQPLKDVEVKVYGEDTKMTDENGTVTFEDVSITADTKIVVTKDSYTTIAQVVGETEECELAVSMEEAPKVCPTFEVDVAKSPYLEGATVIVKDGSETPLKGIVGGKGIVEFENNAVPTLEPGTIVEISQEGYEKQTIVIKEEAPCKLEVELPAKPAACDKFEIKVTDETGKEIAGAKVTTTKLSATTDEAGLATLTDAEKKDYISEGVVVKVTADGYKSTTLTLTKADLENCATILTVKLQQDIQACPHFTVTVNDEDGVVEGATVSIDGTGLTATTDRNGVVTFESNAITENSQITVTKEGYGEMKVSANKDCEVAVTLAKDKPTDPPNPPVVTPPITPPVDPTPEKCENPMITVTPSTGDKPEAGTTVTVTTEDGKTTTGKVTEDGKVTFEPGNEPTLEPGKKVTVTVNGYKETTVPLHEKECNTIITITPTLEACEHFTVNVIDEDGDIINTVKITVDGKTVKTTNGTYTFDTPLVPGTEITFVKSNYETETVIVPEDECDVTITLLADDATEEPTNPEDPDVDPEDPDNGDDGVDEDPNDGNTPDEGPDSDDSDNDNNNNGNQNGDTDSDDNNSDNQNGNNNNGNNTPGNGSNNNTNTNGSNGNKAPSTGSSLLPQTGEQVALYSLVGMLLIGAAFMLFKRNRRKA